MDETANDDESGDSNFLTICMIKLVSRFLSGKAEEGETEDIARVGDGDWTSGKAKFVDIENCEEAVIFFGDSLSLVEIVS